MRSIASAEESTQLWTSLMSILTNEDAIKNEGYRYVMMRTLISNLGDGVDAVDFLISTITSKLFYSQNTLEMDFEISHVALLLEILCNCGANENENMRRKKIVGECTFKYASRDKIYENQMRDSNFNVTEALMQVLVMQIMREDGNEGGLAENAAKALCVLVKGDSTRDVIDRILPLIMKAWIAIDTSSSREMSRSHKSTVTMRYYCLLGNIAVLSNECMAIIQENKLIDQMTESILTSDEASLDPLMQINAIDFLEVMSEHKPFHLNRSKWLLSRRIVDCLLSLSGGLNTSSDADPILGGPALRLLSSFCRLIQNDASLLELDGCKDILQGFRLALSKTNVQCELSRLAFIDAVSSFCASSSDAASLVFGDHETMEGWFILSSAQAKMKAVILHSIAQVFTSDSLTSSDALQLINLFGDLNSCPFVELIMSIIQKPINETRLAAYELLRAVCTRGVGTQMMMLQAGVFEYLVNRETECTKEGREAKYEVICAIVNGEAKGMLSEKVVNALEKIVKEGPHYTKAIAWEMMTE